MTLALYAVLAYMTWTESSAVQGRLGRARASIPRLLTAIVLIFIELMLVTAVALFFSTFSTPILSAALTFGIYVAGHFNTELRNFDQVVTSRPAAWLARGLYHVLPDLSAFDVKTQVVHGLPVGAGYVAWTAGYGLAYIAALLLASHGDLRAPGLQVTAARPLGVGRRGGHGAGRWRSRCRSAATRRIRAREAPTERLLYTRSGTAVSRLALEFRAIASDVYWIRAIQHYGGDRLVADRRSATSCCIRSST